VRQSAAVYSDWGRCYQVVVIPPRAGAREDVPMSDVAPPMSGAAPAWLRLEPELGPIEGRRFHSTGHRLGWFDFALIALFLIGLYTNYTIMVSQKVPLPSAPSGLAGLMLLWRRRDLITPRALIGLMVVVALYVVAMLFATNLSFLPRRTNGLIQLTYSLAIGYALFLTVTQASRRQIAGLLLTFALVILVGCLLEAYGGLRPVSDAVRNVIYSKGVYENDLRDVLFYNRVRPKFFASEPASVTFCYTLFSFLWLVVSPSRWKLLVYLGLVGLGLFAMPGPTLLLRLTALCGHISKPKTSMELCWLLAVAGCYTCMVLDSPTWNGISQTIPVQSSSWDR